jgi:hypothetical protein
MGDELVLRGLATAHLLQVSGTIAQRGASWLQRARTGGLVRLGLTANPDKLQGLVRQLAARDGAATIP